MVKAWMEDKRTWLFDLAHDNLDNDAILIGFLKHYVLQDKTISDVQRDLHFHTNYGDHYLREAVHALRGVLEDHIKIPYTMREAESQYVRSGNESITNII